MATIRNKARLLRRMQRIPPEVKKALRTQLEKNANELVQTVKNFAPVDDGLLRASVMQEDASDATKISRRVSADAKDEKGRPYGRWVEFGTTKSEARPFFWVSYRLKKRRFKSRMARAAKKAIADAVK